MVPWIYEGLSSPDEETARRQDLRPGIAAPDLATVKDFYGSTSLRADLGSMPQNRPLTRSTT
jgi:hypothetical protein